MEPGRAFRRLFALCLFALSVVACSTTAPKILPPDDVEDKYRALYKVMHDDVSKPPAKSGDQQQGGNGGGRGEGEGTAVHMTFQEYARTGYTLAEERCNTFFDAISRATNELQMTKADVSAVGTAAAAVIALVHRSSKPVGITAAAFGLGAAAFDNYQKYALLTAYPAQTRELVMAAMRAYAKDSPADDAKDILEADARVSGYAQLCTYSSIVALAGKAISTATAQPVSQTPASVFTSPDELAKVTQIKTLLGLPNATLTDQSLALLSLLADSSTATALLDQIVAQLPDDVAAKVWDKSTRSRLTPLTQIAPLLSDLAKSNASFAQIIAGIKSASKHPGDAPPTLVIPTGTHAPWSPPIISINGVR